MSSIALISILSRVGGSLSSQGGGFGIIQTRKLKTRKTNLIL